MGSATTLVERASEGKLWAPRWCRIITAPPRFLSSS